MKKYDCILHMTLGLFVLLAVGMGHAQYSSQTLRVKIPFNFSVERQTFSPGEYTLKPLLQNAMLLRNQTGQALMILTIPLGSTEAPSSGKLIFNRYGGQYFLAQIWDAGEPVGRQVTKSPAEIEMAKKDSPGQQIALSFVTPLMEQTSHHP